MLRQCREYAPHLLFGRFERARIINYEVGGLNLYFVGDLRRHTPSNLRTSSIFRNPQALRKTPESLFRVTGHDNQTVETFFGTRLQNQSSFNHSDRVRIPAADLFHPVVFVLNHGRVNNFVELFHPRRRAAKFAKCDFGQP
jgi:hypothetical protein